MSRCLSTALVVYLAVAASGCGQSGSNPLIVRETQFSIVSAEGGAGDVGFEVSEIVADGRLYTSLAGQILRTSGVFSVLVEGADTPYRITVIQRGPRPILVRSALIGAPLPTPSTGGEVNLGVTTGDGTSVTVGTAAATGIAADPEVRIDVCAPLPEVGCRIPDNLGIPGVDFSGSLGDPSATHTIGRFSGTDPLVTTPTVIFLQGAEDNVSAVLRSGSGIKLAARLIKDGRVLQYDDDTGDVILKADL